MGSSQPTISNQIDAFRHEFHAFRQNLPQRHQVQFDAIIHAAYRAGHALNVSEDLDFIRRVLLVAHIDHAARVHARLTALEEHSGVKPPMPREELEKGAARAFAPQIIGHHQNRLLS